MAGLGAAYTLIKNGLNDVIILEAKSAAGGRITTVDFGGNVLELGAQWLHGTGNTLYDLAKHNELILEETSEEGQGLYVRDDGYVFDASLVNEVDFEVGRILEECEEFVHSRTSPSSVGEFLESKFLDHLRNEAGETKTLKLELYDWHVRFQIVDNSCENLREVSAKFWGEYSCTGSSVQQHMNVKNGYRSLVELLVKELPKDALVLEEPVLEVQYGDDIRLKCRSGLVVYCDHVIVTSSVGALKSGFVRFHPALPESITGAIQTTGFHGIGKVFLVFEKRWWDVKGFQLIWRRDVELAEDEEWLRHFTGFDSVLNQPNVLVGWIGGRGVHAMEALPDEDVGLRCVALLRCFLRNVDVPDPIKVFRYV